ncbi:MAG: hypothetical protein R3E01_03130 [Pirellulaceae bacterium]|nr:hypothetical protein [Planctomycetales bacterium]
MIVLLLNMCASRSGAEIYWRDMREVIPGTYGIVPGPSVDLSELELTQALMLDMDLTKART